EPRNAWTDHMSSARWGDLVPHVRYDAATKSESWYVGSQVFAGVGHSSAQNGPDGRVKRIDGRVLPRTYDEMHPTRYDAHERWKVMDEYGIGAAVLSPDVGMLGGSGKAGMANDVPASELAEYRLDLVRAYNEFVADWASADPNRLIPLISIPFWDVPASVAE